MRYMINDKENETEHENQITQIRHKQAQIQYNDGHYVLSNTYALFEAQFMKKISNTEAKLKRWVDYKKACSRHGGSTR